MKDIFGFPFYHEEDRKAARAWDHFEKAWDHFRMWCTTDSLEHLAKARHHAVRSNAIAPNRTMQSVIRWADREAKNPYDPGVS